MNKIIDGYKHLVECRCTLPQFKEKNPPVWHQFITFSEIDSEGNVLPSLTKCNNCGILHRVTEVCRSQILSKEESAALPDIEEIKLSLPQRLISLLEKYNLDLPSYQQIDCFMKNELWGKPIILSREVNEKGDIEGKYLLLIGASIWKIENFRSEHE